MGDIADMILDGILDEETGEFIDDELSMNGGPGYPRSHVRDQREKPKRKKKQKYHYVKHNGVKEIMAGIDIALLQQSGSSIKIVKRNVGANYKP